MTTVTSLAIPDVKLVTPKKILDPRGFFSETLNERTMASLGLPTHFPQENQSLSTQKGIIRGMHAQTPPHAQAKLVRVLTGRILDVVVDARPQSPSFGQHVSVELSGDDLSFLLVPVGFLHGFCTLTENVNLLYKVTDFYAPGCEVGVRWDDPDLKINWPVTSDTAILSDKDIKLPSFKEMPRLAW